MKKIFWISFVLLSMTYFSSCTCHKKESVSTEDVGSSQEERPSKFDPKDYQAQAPDPSKAPSYAGISVEQVVTFDMKKGSGLSVQQGDQIEVTYSLWIYDPKKIGNKGLVITQNEKSTLIVGKNTTLVGLEQGIQGMSVGGQRSIIIPIKDAYGPKGNEKVPPGAIVLAEVTVFNVKKAK